MTYANGVVTTYRYDSCHRLTEEKVTDRNGNVILQYSYVLGKAGERIQTSETSPAGTVTTVNMYDSLNRLINESITDHKGTLANEYAYDAESNRIQKKTRITGDISGIADPSSDEVRIVEGTTTYEYNELNQLVRENAPDGAIVYSYDANGNLVGRDGSSRTTYRYDGENRLLLVTIQEGNSVTTERYTYDAFGNRVSKTVNEEETQYYVVDSGTALAQVSAKVTADGKTITSYLRGEDLICMESDGKVWYYVADGHGSIRALLDGEGNITDRYSYDAFGNVLTRQGSTENDYRYTGEEYNELTGLYYLRARYMDPSTGTFISMDSYPGRMNDPVSLHRYLYANANPVMYTDLTGYFALADFMAAGGIQSALGGVQISVCLHKLMAMANVACTVYDTAMEIKQAILGGGSIGDILFAMLKGAAVGYVIENICKSPLGLVLRPVFVVFGIGNQFDLIMKAFESGDPVEITVRLVQMLVMVYAISQQCFTGETLVAAEDGLKPIGEVKAGELVWSENVETGEAELREVLSVSISCTDTLVHVETSGGAFINTTAGHPFYVEGKGWVTASELAAGDVLRTRDGEGQTVVSVSTEKLEEPVKVYNLEVEEGHTYYVTDGNVLVHNNCGVEENGVQNNGESETVPNPNGKKGGTAHQNTINSIEKTNVNGKIQYERKYDTPNGYKQSRYADAVEIIDGEVTKIHQVGKVNKNGTPIMRESKAIDDIMNSFDYNGAPVYFWPYNNPQMGPIIFEY